MSGRDSPVLPTKLDESSDKPISLIDATQPRDPDRSSQSRSSRQLAVRPTTSSVREGLAKLKYAKWQRTRPDSNSELVGRNDTASPNGNASPLQQDILRTANPEQVESRGYQERGRSLGKKIAAGASSTKDEKQAYEIDVLYENQRGWFFFGIPLYSQSSLLNFDPAPWITKDGQDSAVNITNAQLPDPSWQWAWKSWYVDMSCDVDEEGWQYSFSFSRNFCWHGTHPWFHCFARRRRWLRKRVKREEARGKDLSDLGVAHTMAADYFTIHTKRERSPGSVLEYSTRTGSGSRDRSKAKEIDIPPDDINDIPSLFRSLRLATIDREKIEVVKQFVETGGEELIYLEERIPEIMGMFIFRESRMQLLEHLKRTALDVSRDQTNYQAQDLREQGLLSAVHNADEQIYGGLEHHTDGQPDLRFARGGEMGHKATFSNSSAITIPRDNNPVDVIKGIPGDAGIGIDPTKAIFSPPG